MEQKKFYQTLSIGIITFVTMIIGILLGIALMVKGWGCEARSYPWIIGCGIVTALLTTAITSTTTAISGGK